ncbi:hypothetical protein A994_08846 [Methanobacterium formicicum DSM 3637]|uniref:Uncharacterized protein n=1 Tax=Methanobacterium formicicum (strain DSM 3637 / PP1) TaxID=1204725 RepID=K2RB26_METFP|nr:hypothetical protein A994_08846 [Methanobacterium formicicum DSM 3637]
MIKFFKPIFKLNNNFFYSCFEFIFRDNFIPWIYSMGSLIVGYTPVEYENKKLMTVLRGVF